MSLFAAVFLLWIPDKLKKGEWAECSDWQIAWTYSQSLTDLMLSPAATFPQGSRCPKTNSAVEGERDSQVRCKGHSESPFLRGLKPAQAPPFEDRTVPYPGREGSCKGVHATAH